MILDAQIHVLPEDIQAALPPNRERAQWHVHVQIITSQAVDSESVQHEGDEDERNNASAA
jgi:hypothetical protein